MSDRIRVALDARRLQDRPLGGVGRQLRLVLPHLAERVEIILLTDARRPAPSLKLDLETHALPVPAQAPEVAWLQWSVPQWLRTHGGGFDGVFHGTFNALPLTANQPGVVTIHDLAPLLDPVDFKPAKRMVWRGQTRLSVARAKAVLVFNEHVAGAVREAYATPPDKIVVAPPGIDPVFHPDRAEGVLALMGRYGIRKPYFVALGGAPRRGLEVSVGAWALLRERFPTHQLVIVGPEKPSRRPPGFVFAGQPDDQSWATILAGAEALCYPTRFEGTGFPALEAMASGVPVVCARVAPLPERLGEAAHFCPAPTPFSIAEGLAAVLGNPARGEELRRAGLALAAAAPTWPEVAESVAKAYQKALS
ncbi:MAG: glycosyltransferase family 4 protein [Acidimicrobiales bacterium]